MTWNYVPGESIRIRVILWGDVCHACAGLCGDFSVLVLLVQCFSPARKPFVKEKKSLRGPHQLHSKIIFPLTNTGALRVFPAYVTCKSVIDSAPPPPPRRLHHFLSSLLPGRGSSGYVEMRGGWGQEWCHPSVLSPPKLLMYASGEPHELSNYWITARSEVMTSKTEGYSPSPFFSPLGSKGPFFLRGLWEGGMGHAT